MLKLTKAEAKRLGILPKASKQQKEQPVRDSVRQRRIAYEGEEIRFEMPIPPLPKERPRTFIDERSLANAFVQAHGDVKKFMAMIKVKTVTPKQTKKYEDDIATVTRLTMGTRKPYAIPVEMEIIFRFEGEEDFWPTAVADGDLDNLDKALLDGMEKGGAFTNDRLICRRISVKECHSTKPGMTVILRPAKP
jgi:Holliday junction resolvase RusA-like endonuclease